MDKGLYLKENKGIVVKLANKYFMETSKFSFDDLVSVGNSAALRALDLFNKDRGVKISSYVYTAVENEIANFVHKNKFDIYVTPYIQKKTFKCGVDAELSKYLTHSPLAVSMSTPSDDIEGYGFDATAIPSGSPPILDTLIKKEQETILMEEVSMLPKRERDVVMARFFDGKKLREVANGYGITKQRVEQIQKKALSRLRTKLFKKLDGAMVT